MTRPADGTLTAVIGASRSGKTVWTRRQVKDAPRVLVWDAKGEWGTQFPEFEAVEGWGELRARLRAAGRYSGAPARLAFSPPTMDREAFGTWGDCARLWARAAPATIVAEEVPDVTNSAKAGPGWGTLLRRGLGEGATIYALTQSPAESDKTTLRNATWVHVGRLGWDRDREYAARLLGVDVAHVASLTDLEFLEGIAGRQVTRGRLAFAPKSGLAYVRGRPQVVAGAA